MSKNHFWANFPFTKKAKMLRQNTNSSSKYPHPAVNPTIATSVYGSAQNILIQWIPALLRLVSRVFSWGGLGGPPIQRKFCQSPPIWHLSPFLDQGLSPPPAEVRPQKFEKFKYIFVSNLTTFKLKSTLESCILCLK